MVTPQDVMRELDAGRVRPLYVFYGEEPYLIDEMVRRFVERLVPPEDRDLNVAVYDLTDVPVQVVVEDWLTLPFVGERRLVVGTQALFLTAERLPKKVEHDPDALLNALVAPPTFSTLVLTVPTAKLDERKRVVKALREAAAVVAFSPLKGAALSDWLAAHARDLGVHLAADAAEELVMRVGDELPFLATEVEKMAQYVGPGGTITADVVRELAPRTLEQDVFALIDSVCRVDTAAAYRMLRDLWLQQEEPVRLVALLARQFRLILQVKTMSAKGYGTQQIAQRLRVHPYGVKKAMEQGRRFTEEHLLAILDALAEADYCMKAGWMDKELAVEAFVARLAHWLQHRARKGGNGS